MYGIQTKEAQDKFGVEFENDVNMYGIQTRLFYLAALFRLRMM